MVVGLFIVELTLLVVDGIVNSLGFWDATGDDRNCASCKFLLSSSKHEHTWQDFSSTIQFHWGHRSGVAASTVPAAKFPEKPDRLRDAERICRACQVQPEYQLHLRV